MWNLERIQKLVMNVLGSWLGQFTSIVTGIVLVWMSVGVYRKIIDYKKNKKDEDSKQEETIIKNSIRDDRNIKLNTDLEQIAKKERKRYDVLDVDLIMREIIDPIAAHTYDRLKAIDVKGVIYEISIELWLQTPEGEKILITIHGDKAKSVSREGDDDLRKQPKWAIGIEIQIRMLGSAVGSTKTVDSYTIEGKFRGENRNLEGHWKVKPFLAMNKPLWTGIRPYNLDDVMRAVDKASEVMQRDGEEAIGIKTEKTEERIHIMAHLGNLRHIFEKLSHIKNENLGSFAMMLLNDAPDQIEEVREVCWETITMTRELDHLLNLLGEETQNAVKTLQEMKNNGRTKDEAFWEIIKKAKEHADALDEMIRPLF